MFISISQKFSIDDFMFKILRTKIINTQNYSGRYYKLRRRY